MLSSTGEIPAELHLISTTIPDFFDCHLSLLVKALISFRESWTNNNNKGNENQAMTIPASHNYCPACDDYCLDHPTTCVICGATLVSRGDSSLGEANGTAAGASTSRNNNNNRLNRQNRGDGSGMVVPEHLVEEIRQNSRALSELLRHVQQEVQVTREAQRELMQSLQSFRQQFVFQLPSEITDPQGAGGGGGRRPTAKETLQNLPRTVLHERSSLFFRASFAVMNERNHLEQDQDTTKWMEAIPGEVGESGKPFRLDLANIIVAEPRTGKGMVLSTETQERIQHARSRKRLKGDDAESSQPKTTEPTPVVLYMERGDGVTFVQKALLAQRAGAEAVVIGNNVSDPWPYIMQDSLQEARKYNLTIPVVMIKQQDGQWLLSNSGNKRQKTQPLLCSLHISLHENKECVICTDSFEVGQTVVRLPSCGHIFHETCVLRWLETHNTCPYCRRELPTDDPHYEEERRRLQRTHAGSSGPTQGNGTPGGWNDFYG